MTGKKPYSQPQVYEVALDHEQAILSACSILTTSASAGGSVGCRRSAACRNYPSADPNGCKRSSLPTTYMGRRCHDSGPRAS
ncbi:MAG: hypothetical protein OJF47_001169 [Nitrospira sp.]|nr:MAG: hypothetical protein OJF47_001169 [Nitrospira sp.]